MSNFPTSLDDDVTLPRVDNNITEVGDIAVNALRDAMFNTQAEIGIGASGTAGSIANRLNVALDPAGQIKPSALSLLPQLNNVVDSQISPTAGIKESKLQLDYSTAALYNYINNFNTSLNTALNFIINSGSKLEPHLQGVTYRHYLTHFDVSPTNAGYFKNQYGLFRDNTNLYTLLNDINLDYVSHQKANGTAVPTPPSNNFAHNAAGIQLKSSNFSSIPQTTNNVQTLAEYLDGAGILTIGSRIQTLYGNGISRTSRSNSLNAVTVTNNALSSVRLGQPVVPITTVTAYLTDSGNIPFDDIDTGDDIIEFTPSVAELNNNVFDSKFTAIKIGDIISINYGSVVAPFIIKEYKYVSGVNRRFLVRIHGKNLFSGTTFTARIDRALFNINKYGALSLAAAPSSINGVLPSLIISNPRGAQVLGIGFNPNLLDSLHYNLYLSVYPTGNPTDAIYNMAPIDVTGNSGATPGKYTLESVVNTLNSTFRRPGYNYRFIAFAYQGNLGLMLADSINNVSFSVISGVLGADGLFSQALSNTTYPNNVIDIFGNIDPLGLGPSGVNMASPPFATSFNPVIAALNPTKLIVPLSKNNYYVDGAEKETMKSDIYQLLDDNKDGYWFATISNRLVIAGSRIQTTYTITGFDLSGSGLKAGKTLVVQPVAGGTAVDFGRFIIQSVEFSSCDGYVPTTKITVYDAIHSTGVSPNISSGVGTNVRLYFSSDSVGFNVENSSDVSSSTNYKRHFEVYIDSQSHTFTHERARLLANGTTGSVNGVTLYSSSELANINIFKVSPKLRGYTFSNVRKINLQINSYDVTTGVFDGYLCRYDGYVLHAGPATIGKKGEVVRFFDETNVDYIDFIFDIDTSVPQITSTKNIDIQLFPTLSLDDEVMLLGTCQVNDITRDISYLRDGRQFGNTSEKHLTNSAIDFVNTGNRLLYQNGVINGFDITAVSSSENSIIIRGGAALVNGNVIELNNTELSVPLVQERYSSSDYSKINWALCLNSKGEYKLIALTDYDSVSPVTPNSPGRIVNVKNPDNGLIYTVESRSFVEIVEKRKDLVILYIVSSVVDGTGVLTSLTYTDSRKHVFENNSFIDPVVTSTGSQGNFYNFDSLATWLKFNSKYNNNIGIKGDISTSGTHNFTNNYVVKLNGNNVSALTFASGSNVTFNNFHFNEVPIIISGGATVVFNNCTFDPTSVTANSGAIVTLNGCKFDQSSLVVNSGSTVSFTGNNYFKDASVTLSQSITLSTSANFVKTNFNISSSKGFIISTDDVSFSNCSFTYSFDPTNPSDGNYTTGNTINTGSGMIYVSNGSAFQRKNLSITGCAFTSTTSDHYPFISLEFNHDTSMYQDINISNNKFYSSTGTSGSPIDDRRGALIIANNVITSSLIGPRLVNVSIENNVCDKNQIIAIISKTDGSSLVNNGLSTDNVSIKNNTCGTIGFFTRYESKASFANSSSLVKNRNSLLLIEGNDCDYIGTVTYTGGLFSSFIWSNTTVETGKVIINNNSCSYISTGVRGHSSLAEERRDTLVITNNTLEATISTYYIHGAYAMLINGSGSESTTSSGNVIISNNSFNYGTAVDSDNTTKTIGYYEGSNLLCNIPATITNNIFKGIGNTTASAINNFILYISASCIVTGNKFFRQNFTFTGSGAYIGLGGGNSIITDNTFDSPTIDGTSESLVNIISGTAIYERNINQTAYVAYELGKLALVSGFSSNSAAASVGAAGSNTLGNYTSYWSIQTNANGSSIGNTYAMNVSSKLPLNVTVISCVLGLVLDSTFNTLGDTVFTLKLVKSAEITYDSTSSATLLNSVADIKNSGSLSTTDSSTSTLTVGAGGISNATFSSATQYLQVNAANMYSKNTLINLVFTLNSTHTTGSTSAATVISSPFLIKYRW